MISRTLAFGAGLIAVASVGWIAFGQDAPPQLCVNHHPAKRAANLTYGGLPVQSGYQRDHIQPPGLGGADDISNVKYQRCDKTGANGECLAGPAKTKDDDEHAAIGNMCSGKWTQPYAIKWLADRWPTDPAHGYFLADKPPQK